MMVVVNFLVFTASLFTASLLHCFTALRPGGPYFFGDEKVSKKSLRIPNSTLRVSNMEFPVPYGKLKTPSAKTHCFIISLLSLLLDPGIANPTDMKCKGRNRDDTRKVVFTIYLLFICLSRHPEFISGSKDAKTSSA